MTKKIKLNCAYSFRKLKLVLKSWGSHFHFIPKCIKNGATSFFLITI